MRHIAHLLLPMLALGASAQAADYYVSPSGSDTNSGLGPEDAQALRTIQAAADLLQPGDTCLILAGVYRETVTFPTSGLPDAPITVRPFGDGEVIITGCDSVEGWTRHEGDVWKAPMPWTLGLGRNQVFENGEVLIEARFPNEPAPDLGMYVSDLSPLWPTFGEFHIPRETSQEQPGRIVSDLLAGQPDDLWKGALYYGVHYEGWCAQTGVIESSGPGEILVGDRTRTWWFTGAYAEDEGRGMIVGSMNALDQPGEWHWQDGTLYLVPRGGAPANIEAKRRQLAFDLSGRSHIRLEGLTMRAASLRLDGSESCVVDRCDLAFISHFTHHTSMGQIEEGRDTIKSGETGIYVSGRDNAFTNCSIRSSAGAGFHLRGYHHTIHNCLIDEVSYTAHYLNAITDAVSDFPAYEDELVGGHVITYNTMRNAGRHFFNFYGNGTSLASRDRKPMDYMATLFAHNHLYNGMLQTRDAGFLTGYYSSGGTLNGLNSQVAYNVMHDSYDISAMRWNVLGIVYLDAGTCDVDVHDNLLWAVPGSLQRGLWFNTMCVDINEYDNVFHPQFERTCAELTAEDFPRGAPFRFGHDFDDPPPVAEWPPVEQLGLALDAAMDRSAGVRVEGGVVSGLTDGEWLAVGPVDFSEGWSSAALEFVSDATAVNTDRSSRAAPRHRHATDPLVLEATVRDGAHEDIKDQWTFVWNTTDSSWIRFDGVPLGEGYRRFRAVYGNAGEGRCWLEARLDSPDGPLAGQVELPPTDTPRDGRIQIYAEALGEIAEDAVGTRNVFLVFRSEDGLPVGEFEYFRFEQYRGNIALLPTEVRFELRLDGPQGELVGVIYPKPTDGGLVTLVEALEPVEGSHTLYMVVRSAADGLVGEVHGLALGRAVDRKPLAGLGDPPRVRDGRMVLPEPTHRPCARPDDLYAAARATSPLRPQALFPATWMAAPPTIDGRLNDWPPDLPVMRLAESYDGRPSAAPESTAWIGYDAEALYIAARHPVADAVDLSYASHTWGLTDAMEVAFRDALIEPPGPILNLYGWPDGHFESTGRAGAPVEAVARLGDAVTYAATISDGEWACEWRIPFEACALSPHSAPAIAVNLGVRKLAQDAWVVWRGTGAQTYLVDRAGVVVFPDEFTAAHPLPTGGLAVWLDASDAESVEVDDEGRVAVWRDRSGHGRHADQQEPEFRPLLVADGLNGRPSLRFSEELRTRLELPNLSEEPISATALVVFSNPVVGAEVNHDPRLFTASDGEEHDYLCGVSTSIPGLQIGGPRQLCATFTNRWAKAVRIGCFSPLYQTFLEGDISEIIVYDRVLTPSEQQAARVYLMLKWGLDDSGAR